jgi:PRTRC genetic system protein B
MPDHSTLFEATGAGLVLTNAILLYRTATARGAHYHDGGHHAAPAFASIHGIEQGDDGQPVIAAGTSLTRAHLRRWSEALGRTVKPEFLPDNILVAHPDMLAWWRPAQMRGAYFALSNPPSGLRLLSARTVVQVPYPAHLFIATRSGLGVYALGASERPTAATPLLHSPILNVFVNGRLCWGDIPKPRLLSIASIPHYESAVFDSWSTHPNPGQERTVTGKGGLVRLWDSLAARQATRFPVKRLKPFGAAARGQRGQPMGTGAADTITVASLIAMSSRS